MLRLTLLRHAKAVAESPRGDDFSRELSAMGETGARLLHGWLLQNKIRFDLALCSAARRTQMTADLALANHAKQRIDTRALYNCSISDACALLATNAGTAKSVVIVGHNPTMADMARWLVGDGDMTARAQLAGGYPPGSLLIAELSAADWHDVRAGCGTLLHFIRVKDLDRTAGD